MAKFNASDLKWYVGSKIIAEQTNGTIDIDITEIDVTSKTNDGWGDFIMGLRKWSGTCEGIIDYASGGATYYDYGTLADIAIARTALTVSFKLASGGVILTGTAYIKKISTSAQMEDKATYSLDFTGAGALVKS